MWKKIWPFLKNKYIIVTFLFIVKLAFFENIDLFTLRQMKANKAKLHQQNNEKLKLIDKKKRQSASLNDPLLREVYAREEYKFKRENEEIFIISNK